VWSGKTANLFLTEEGVPIYIYDVALGERHPDELAFVASLHSFEHMPHVEFLLFVLLLKHL
jgi:hypothetical protein